MQASKIFVPLAAGAVVLGGLGIADAATKPPAKAKHAGAHAGLLRHVEHGTLVVSQKGKEVTLVIARGTVSAVSPTSLTVTSADKTATTYAIATTTRVRQVGTGLTTASSIVSGATVEVVGVGSGSTQTARRIVIAKSTTS